MAKNKDQKKAVLEKIQVYLRFRAHSEHELKCKLLKHFDLSSIEEALEEAKEQGWLPEPQKLAEQLAEEWHRKKKGYLLILSALKAKHLPLVPKEQEKEEEKCLWWLKKKYPDTSVRDADSSVKDADSSVKDADSSVKDARLLRHSREGGNLSTYMKEIPAFAGMTVGRDAVPAVPADPAVSKERQKISRFLMQKGFESETIKNTLQKYFKDRKLIYE